MAGRAGPGTQYLYLTSHMTHFLCCQDCQIFCSKLVNSLQQSQSIARADGSHLIKCLLILELSRERDTLTYNTGVQSPESAAVVVCLVIRNKKT